MIRLSLAIYSIHPKCLVVNNTLTKAPRPFGLGSFLHLILTEYVCLEHILYTTCNDFPLMKHVMPKHEARSRREVGRDYILPEDCLSSLKVVVKVDQDAHASHRPIWPRKILVSVCGDDPSVFTEPVQ